MEIYSEKKKTDTMCPTNILYTIIRGRSYVASISDARSRSYEIENPWCLIIRFSQPDESFPRLVVDLTGLRYGRQVVVHAERFGGFLKLAAGRKIGKLATTDIVGLV